MRSLRKNSIVLFSGGLDSYVMLCKAKLECERVVALYVNYGSRHSEQEIKVSSELAQKLGVTLRVATIPRDLFISGSALIDGELPLGREREKTDINPAYVPNRNMLLASLAGALAISEFGFEPSSVCMGFHATDGSAFVDTTVEASRALDECLKSCTNGAVSFCSFAELKKHEILWYAVGDLGISVSELALTRSCYQGTVQTHCGLCDACIARHQAFLDADLVDATLYAEPFEL